MNRYGGLWCILKLDIDYVLEVIKIFEFLWIEFCDILRGGDIFFDVLFKEFSLLNVLVDYF